MERGTVGPPAEPVAVVRWSVMEQWSSHWDLGGQATTSARSAQGRPPDRGCPSGRGRLHLTLPTIRLRSNDVLFQCFLSVIHSSVLSLLLWTEYGRPRPERHPSLFLSASSTSQRTEITSHRCSTDRRCRFHCQPCRLL